MTYCRSCGHDDKMPTSLQPPEAEHCGYCPPWVCDQCGETCSTDALCSCWVAFKDLPLADIKGLLARANLSTATTEDT